MSGFKDSQEAAFRRLVRGAVRKGPLTKGQRDVTVALVDLWFHHRSGPEGCIHPGRAKLAKKAGVTEKTVSRTLAMLRQHGAIVATDRLHGEGQKSTRYKVRMFRLLDLCGCPLPEWMSGDLVPLNGPLLRAKCPTTFTQNVPPLAGQNVPQSSRYAWGAQKDLSKRKGSL